MRRILWLGPPTSVGSILERHGFAATRQESKIAPQQARGFDMAVCYRYRHIVVPDIIDALEGNIVNLHIAMLPWNRGADPNLWSFLEDTPKGATLHWMDAGLDTGDIVVQQETEFGPEETLATTYRALERIGLALLDRALPAIVAGTAPHRSQSPGGSFHRAADKKNYEHLLADLGWSTPVGRLIGKGLSRL
jgi:methionyl-tRNA formyltransferase